MGIGSNLWSWHRAQATVKPIRPRADDINPIVDQIILIVGEPLADGDEAQRRQRLAVVAGGN